MKSSPSPESKPHYLGHRERLRGRFQAAGAEGVADYELVEMLLCLAMPRGDVKPLAKALLCRFKTISALLSADEKLLMEIKGVGAAAVHAIKLTRALGIAAAREEIIGKNVLSSWRQVLDYCYLVMVNDQQEQMRLLYLDKKNQLILDELHQMGTIDQAPVYPREIIRRALELGASSLILVHNHPSGDPTPSRGDVEMTVKIQEIGRGVGVSVHDHLVIGQGNHVSLKSLGLI